MLPDLSQLLQGVIYIIWRDMKWHVQGFTTTEGSEPTFDQAPIIQIKASYCHMA